MDGRYANTNLYGEHRGEADSDWDSDSDADADAEADGSDEWMMRLALNRSLHPEGNEESDLQFALAASMQVREEEVALSHLVISDDTDDTVDTDAHDPETKAPLDTSVASSSSSSSSSSFSSSSSSSSPEFVFGGAGAGAGDGQRRYDVVVDGANVGCAHGSQSVHERVGRTNRVSELFSFRGLQLVIQHFTRLGKTPLVFIPQYIMHSAVVHNNVHNKGHDIKQRIDELRRSGVVAYTPAGAHDDYFILRYACKHELDVVSNDRFKKEVNLQGDGERKTQLQTFLETHLIPYTFVGDEFIPNPDPSNLAADKHHGRTTRTRNRRGR